MYHTRASLSLLPFILPTDHSLQFQMESHRFRLIDKMPDSGVRMDWSRPDDPTRLESFEADPLCCSANSANSPVPVPKPVSTPLPVQTKPMSCNSTIYNMDYTWLWSTINGMMQLPLSRSSTEQSSFGQQTKACLVPVLAHAQTGSRPWLLHLLSLLRK